MHHHTELSFVDEFRWVSPLHYLRNGWQNAVLLWFMLQAGPPSLHYHCAVVLHSCIVLPPVGHSSNHQYHCCQFTRHSSCVSNFYRTFKVFIWLSHLVYGNVHVFVSLHVLDIVSTLETANGRCGWRATDSSACATEKTRTVLLIVVS